MGKKKNDRANERPDLRLQVTSAKDWKNPVDGDLVQLPSGNVVRCRRPGMNGFLELGIVPNPLLPFVTAGADGETTQMPTMSQLTEDPELLQATADFTDKVFMYCVTEPQILMVPSDPEAERDEEFVYLDETEVEDRIFVLQYAVGGTRSVQRFRQLQITNVADVATESIVLDPS